MNRNLYGLMIKYPEPGRVKTRLAKDIGHEKAAEICQHVTEQIMINTSPLNQLYRRIVFFDPPERLKDFQSWLSHEQFIPQQGKDVGERMDKALRELLACNAEKAVLTGADIPDLNSTIIAKAFAALDHADIVIGPAADGGYYLIGMKSPHPEIFFNISWSTPQVYKETLLILEHLHLRYRCVETLSDLDTSEDYNKFVTQTARLIPEKSS